MQPILVVMAILGCGDAGDTCQQVDRMPTTYASVAACNAAAADELGRRTDLSYPVVMAQCQAAPSSMVADATRAKRR